MFHVDKCPSGSNSFNQLSSVRPRRQSFPKWILISWGIYVCSGKPLPFHSFLKSKVSAVFNDRFVKQTLTDRIYKLVSICVNSQINLYLPCCTFSCI
jgi:hypothetical protein